jgi:hypothetical protein
MQLRFATDLSADEYVRQEAWKNATLEKCPLHPEGGCGLAKHGTYERKSPKGTKIARWYCLMGKTTFSLLPDCLASHLSGSLKEIENVIVEVEGSRSQEAAAGKIRIDIELPGALRWIRRRVLLVRAALVMLIELFPSLFAGCNPTIASFRSSLGVKHLLFELRSSASAYLPVLPPPLGFAPRFQRQNIKKSRFQHKAGSDPPT